MASYFSASPAETFFARIYRRVSSKLVRYLRVKVHIPTVSRVSNVNITVAWILVSLPSRFNRKKLESICNFVVSHFRCVVVVVVVVSSWFQGGRKNYRCSLGVVSRGCVVERGCKPPPLSSSRPPPVAAVLPVLRLDVQSAGDSRPCFAFLRVAHAPSFSLSLSPAKSSRSFFPFFHLDPLLDRTNRFDRLRSDNRIKKFSVSLFVRDSQQSRAMHGVVGAVTRRSPGSR